MRQLFYPLAKMMNQSLFFHDKYRHLKDYLNQLIYLTKINVQIIHLIQNFHFYAPVKSLSLLKVLQNAKDLQLFYYYQQFQPIL